MPSNNFKQFDESKNLMMNDTDYSSNTQRQNGVTPGIAEPELHNKLYYQVSTMAKAFGDYIVEKGYESNDSNVKELTTSINNAINKAIDDKTKGVYLPVGGGTINGDLHITGNLIIGDSDVSEDNKVTSDLIQDLYNKVYQPSQTIYVDAVNGNDNNDGSTDQKPVKTMDKAVELIKVGVTTVTIYLRAYSTNNTVYNMTKTINCGSAINIPRNSEPKKITNLNIATEWTDYAQHNYRAKLVIPYGCVWFGQYDSHGNIFSFGNILAHSATSINLNRLIIDMSNPTIQDRNKSLNAIVVKTTNFILYDCDISLHSSCELWHLRKQICNNFELGGRVKITGNGFLTHTFIPTQYHDLKEDGTFTEPGIAYEQVRNNNSYIGIVLKDASGATISSSITSNENNGFTNGVYVNYKNY